MTAIVLTASASTLSAYLIEEFNVSSLPLPQGIGRASSRPTNTFFVKALSLLVKKVNLASGLVVSHACVLGVKSPLTYEIEFDSISNLRFLKCDSVLLANQYEEILKSALSSKEGVAPLFVTSKKEVKEEKVPSSLPHFMMATTSSLKKQKPSVKKEVKVKVATVASSAKKAEVNPEPMASSAATERKEEGKGRKIPHYMLATTASMKKQQPSVKREEKKKKAAAPMHHSAPVNAPAAPEHAQEKEIREVSRGDMKRGPHYLTTTATLKAKQLPVKQMMKKQSRLPPRMVLVKRVIPPYNEEFDVEKKEEKKQEDQYVEERETVKQEENGCSPKVESRESNASGATSKESAKGSKKVSISTSPERGASLPVKKEEKEGSSLFLLLTV
ncbi:hypothetical protein WA588_005017 [Blastocystis sp. NMH]